MKKTLLIAAVAVVGAAANAQSFTESWTPLTASASFTGASGTINSTVSWEYRNVSPGGPGLTSWFEGNDSVFGPNSTPNYLAANFNNSTGSNNISNYLMSPVRTFNNGDTISFFTRTVTSVSFPDRLRLRLSTNGASTATGDFGTILLTVNPNLTTSGYPTAWQQFSATITGLSGATSGRFAFHYDVDGTAGPSGSNSDYIGIDTIRYTAVPEPATMAALGLGVAALLRRRRK